MHRILLPLLLSMLTPTAAFAWDFSCSPKNTTEIEPLLPPQLMMMLDRSGSMDDADGIVYNTCRVCEDPKGNRREVASAADCAPTGPPWEATTNLTKRQFPNQNGYSYTTTFTGLPVVKGRLTLTVAIRGDFNDDNDGYEVFVNGNRVRYQRVNKGCSTTFTRTFEIDASFVPGTTADVVIVTDRSTRFADGVDTDECSTNSVGLTLRSETNTYLGSIQDKACGGKDKWEQALAAIDAVTKESETRSPELAAFGLGLFNDSGAGVFQECKMTNNSPIMSTLNSTGPSGNTPTALAIRTALASDCVGGASMTTVSDTQTMPTRSGDREGFSYNHRLVIPPQTTNLTADIYLQGDYGGACEYAQIWIDGVLAGTHDGRNENCDTTPRSRSFTIPASATADGVVNIEVRNRTKLWNSASCSAGTDGVDLQCGTNSSYVEVKVPNRISRPAATLLITDGEPTVGYDGQDAYPAAVIAACAHRDLANLYVVGQGAGTDVEFNNILAAAGGTGSCDGGVDPCTSPSDYKDLLGKCTGSFQTNNAEELLAAIAAITNDIQCLFDVNFSGAPVTDVPLDPTGLYPYLYVDGRFATVGNQRIYQKSSPLAVPAGEGWEFASATESKRVRFTDYYCNQVQTRTINQVSTQLACLCEETPGAPCVVPDAGALGVCPDGVWTCVEGIDICEPDVNCCVEGSPCTIPTLEGVCAEGVTKCPSSSGLPVCVQVNFPETEVCNGLDDDCDGEVDEIGGTCNVPGGVGRCLPGYRGCSGTSEVCLPLYEPMPELCNGIDDDCDGTEDNITRSWNATFNGVYTLPSADRPKACDIKNTCTCAGGAADNNAGTDFTSYLAEWDPVCECGAGLEAPETTDTSAPSTASSDVGPSTGCSAVDGGLTPMLLLGLLGLTRRRRN